MEKSTKKTIKSEQVHMRVTPEEKETINQKAKEFNMKASEYAIIAATKPELLYKKSLICKIEAAKILNTIHNRLVTIPTLNKKNINTIAEVLDDVQTLYNSQDHR